MSNETSDTEGEAVAAEQAAAMAKMTAERDELTERLKALTKEANDKHDEVFHMKWIAVSSSFDAHTFACVEHELSQLPQDASERDIAIAQCRGVRMAKLANAGIAQSNEKSAYDAYLKACDEHAKAKERRDDLEDKLNPWQGSLRHAVDSSLYISAYARQLKDGGM